MFKFRTSHQARGVGPRFHQLTRSGSALLGLIAVALFVLAALLGPRLAPYPYTEFHIDDRLQPPSMQYLFGTDQFGRDVFSRAIVGTRYVLVLALSATGLGLVFGIVIGSISGYYGGLVDEILMRIMDAIMSFPSLLLGLLVLVSLGAGLRNLVLAITVLFTPRVARVIRSSVLDTKTKEFVEAAKIRGESAPYIMFFEILPNASGIIMVEFSIRIAYAIFIGASMGFLGLGVLPPTPDWGLMVSEGRNYLRVAPWMVLFPSLAIASLVIGVNFLADGVRRVMESR